MSIEDQVMDVLLTASFADADARLACEEKLRSLIGERDRALTNEYIAKSNRDEMIPEFKHLFARAEAAEARAAECRDDLIAFLPMWAVRYSEMQGLDGLHPDHYDLMEKYGLRMVDFKRAAQPQEAYMVANAEGQIWYGAPEMEKEDAERACTDANRHGIGRAPHRVIKVKIREIPSP